jgi:NAD(P)-dependent dehydrogenase (short-subunit alcohol dehydrogenase family)
MKLDNKTAVITGAGRGIGRSISLAFARAGAKVALAARTREQIEKVAEEVNRLGGKALVAPCDVSSSIDVKAFADLVKSEYGSLDILVNNAGVSKRAKFLESDDETWLEVIRINLFGAYLCTKAFLPLIQRTGKGRIIMMASTAAKMPVPFNTAYSSSKHGLLGLTKSLAVEIALMGYPEITVNAICPFFVNTEMFTGPQGYVAQMMENTGLSESVIVDKAIGRSLQSRLLDPEEIASLTVYLASEDAKGITGQAINICGGRTFY